MLMIFVQFGEKQRQDIKNWQGGNMVRFAVITGLAAGSWLLVGAAFIGMMNFWH